MKLRAACVCNRLLMITKLLFVERMRIRFLNFLPQAQYTVDTIVTRLSFVKGKQKRHAPQHGSEKVLNRNQAAATHRCFNHLHSYPPKIISQIGEHHPPRRLAKNAEQKLIGPVRWMCSSAESCALCSHMGSFLVTLAQAPAKLIHQGLLLQTVRLTTNHEIKQVHLKTSVGNCLAPSSTTTHNLIA